MNIEQSRAFPKVGSFIILFYVIESLVVLSTNYLPYASEEGVEALSIESGLVLPVAICLLIYLIRNLLDGNKVVLQLNYILLAVNILPVLFSKGSNISAFESVDYLSILGGGVVLLIVALCHTSDMQKWFMHENL